MTDPTPPPSPPPPQPEIPPLNPVPPQPEIDPAATPDEIPLPPGENEGGFERPGAI